MGANALAGSIYKAAAALWRCLSKKRRRSSKIKNRDRRRLSDCRLLLLDSLLRDGFDIAYFLSGFITVLLLEISFCRGEYLASNALCNFTTIA
jgi:hypothetical protein